MNKIKAIDLLQKYASGKCTPEEEALFEDWYLGLNRDRRMALTESELEETEQHLLNDLLAETQPLKKTVALWPRIAAAASVLLLMTALYWGFTTWKAHDHALVENHQIKPGGDKAILILGNGRQIVLATAKNGILASQGNTVINKSANGEVSYQIKGGEGTSGTELTYNTIQTPLGGQYQVILPDGSHVWLNALSSIRFPTQFTGKDRQVAITGEAYFEVVHDERKTFIVIAGRQTVQVLGTHFNINAYNDEPSITTTLLEGSVKLSDGNYSTLIKPGEQAILMNNNQEFKTAEADLEKTIAWKNGNFAFTDDGITTVMRQVSRWYNVDVVYQSPVTQKVFMGSISRFSDFSKVLSTLQLTGLVHFKIEGRRVTVISD